MPRTIAARRAEAATNIATMAARVEALRGELDAERRERRRFKAYLARKRERYIADTKMRFEAIDKAKAVAAQTGKRTKISCRMSTGGDAPPRPFADFDAQFQTKMHDIMSDIKAAEEDVRKAKAAREAMV